MKKKTKIWAVTGGICAGVGVIFLGAGIALGGAADLADAISVKVSDFRRVAEWLRPGQEEYWDDDITNLDPDRWQCVSAAGIKDMDIEMEAGYLEIGQYDGDVIKVYTRNNDSRTEIDWEGEELDISSDMSSWFWNRGKAVKILIPQSQAFDFVSVEMDAGEAVLDSIKTSEMSVSADAASVTITGNVQTQSSEWSVNAGSLEVNSLQSKQTGFECAAGKIQVRMTGSEDDYSLYGDVSAGSLEYGSQEFSSLEQSFRFGDSNAKNIIDVECSAGSIVIDFIK